jgi:hypothetical protein
VPLAPRPRRVAVAAQHLGHQRAALGDVPGVAVPVVGQLLDRPAGEPVIVASLSNDARVGEQIAVVWKRFKLTSSAHTRSIVAVRTSPPNVDGSAGPASSMSTMTMFGASSGRCRAGSRCAYTDSCIVRPATLAEGTGGKGSTSPELDVGLSRGITTLTDATSWSRPRRIL